MRPAGSGRSCQTLGVVNTNTLKPETMRLFVGFEFNTPRVTGGANSERRSQAGRTAALRAALNTNPVLALKREQEQMLLSHWGRSPFGSGSLSLLARFQLPFHVGCR